MRRNSLTDIPGIRVGHAGDARVASGTTAILFDAPVTAAVDVRGGGRAPARPTSSTPSARWRASTR